MGDLREYLLGEIVAHKQGKIPESFLIAQINAKFSLYSGLRSRCQPEGYYNSEEA